MKNNLEHLNFHNLSFINFIRNIQMKGHKLAVVEIRERYKRHTKRGLASTQHTLFHTLARRTGEK